MSLEHSLLLRGYTASVHAFITYSRIFFTDFCALARDEAIVNFTRLSLGSMLLWVLRLCIFRSSCMLLKY